MQVRSKPQSKSGANKRFCGVNRCHNVSLTAVLFLHWQGLKIHSLLMACPWRSAQPWRCRLRHDTESIRHRSYVSVKRYPVRTGDNGYEDHRKRGMSTVNVITRPTSIICLCWAVLLIIAMRRRMCSSCAVTSLCRTQQRQSGIVALCRTGNYSGCTYQRAIKRDRQRNEITSPSNSFLINNPSSCMVWRLAA